MVGWQTHYIEEITLDANYTTKPNPFLYAIAPGFVERFISINVVGYFFF